MGAIGSILSNFVAVIYLRMHAAASTSLDAFHRRLVASEGLLLGNLIASRINNDEKRWATFSQLAPRIFDVERNSTSQSVSADGKEQVAS